MNEKNKQIHINYTNHRGKTTNRQIVPIEVWYGKSPWYEIEQWFLKAFDVTKQAERDFAMTNIHHIEESMEDNAQPTQKSQPQNGTVGEVKLFTDGGSRGNPGPSAIGFVLLDMSDEIITKDSKYLGITTNNQAEYQGLREGLEHCQALNVHTVHVYMDSLLVVNQMKGVYKIKNRDLWPVYESIKSLQATFKHVDFTHVPRELNKIADEMVNECLDAHVG